MNEFFKKNISEGEFNYNFIESGHNGTGYVMKDRKAIFVVGECTRRDDRRLFAMGAHWTIPKKFPENKEEFDEQIKDLQSIVNIYIRSYYQAADKSGINNFKPVLDITISLTP